THHLCTSSLEYSSTSALYTLSLHDALPILLSRKIRIIRCAYARNWIIRKPNLNLFILPVLTGKARPPICWLLYWLLPVIKRGYIPRLTSLIFENGSVLTVK